MADHDFANIYKEIWEELKKIEDFNQLDDREKEYLRESVEQIILDGSKEVDRFSWMPEDVKSTSEEEGVLSSLDRHLTAEEKIYLKYGLLLETFTMSIKTTAVSKVAHFARGGKEFFEVIDLSTPDGIARATNMQMASILVEIILLLLAALGFKISYTKEQMESVISKVNTLLNEHIRQNIEEFINEWSKAKSLFAKAKLIFNLLRLLFTPGFLLKMVRAIASPLSLFEKFRLIPKLIVAIKNAIKDPRGLMGKIAVALKHAPDVIANKLINISDLQELSKKK